MAAVLRHLVSGAALTVGLPPLPPPEDNGPLPGSVGGIPRPALATLSDVEWAVLAEGEAAEDEAEADADEDAEVGPQGEEIIEDEEGRTYAVVQRIPDDELLSWEDLKDLPVRSLAPSARPSVT